MTIINAYHQLVFIADINFLSGVSFVDMHRYMSSKDSTVGKRGLPPDTFGSRRFNTTPAYDRYQRPNVVTSAVSWHLPPSRLLGPFKVLPPQCPAKTG